MNYALSKLSLRFGGLDGINCWDLNQNGVCDLPTEDINLDGNCTAVDCTGSAGPAGPAGPVLPVAPTRVAVF